MQNNRLHSLVFSCIRYAMADKTVSLRIPEKNLKALDRIADYEQRSRSFMINQGVNLLIDHDQQFREAVEAGLRDVRAGRAVPHVQVVAEFERRWGRGKAKRRA